MKAEEIRAKVRDTIANFAKADSTLAVDMAVDQGRLLMEAEIAAQLAELNQNLSRVIAQVSPTQLH